ncbi:MAG TPA: hypothetical protein VFH31_10465 [Pyrinomonadaceae bacterium]|nr:hypothetical protein [Pyrinomonadaceae bacterium]
MTAFFGLSLGLMNGVFIAYLRLNPFVVTLASGAIFAGMTLVINVSGYWERVVVGAIVLIAVLTDLLRRAIEAIGRRRKPAGRQCTPLQSYGEVTHGRQPDRRKGWKKGRTLYVANEGDLIAIVRASDVSAVLTATRSHPLAAEVTSSVK